MTTGTLRRILGRLAWGIAVFAILGAAAAGASEAAKKEDGGKKGGKETVLVQGPPGGPLFYDLPDILVNIDTGGQKPVYLKVKVALQVTRVEDGPNLEAFKPRVLDDLLLYLRELRLENLKNPRVIDRLRQELLMRIKLAVKPIKVNDVLFREFLVQ
jgi:flagellar protein FliL